ncbi:class I SAM-dependent DNA methyltransferase [Flavobacteriaceae bacterium]|nr:class I SAM-dependent DNA methyltransferase [Flavobacteriaceae bacterium]
MALSWNEIKDRALKFSNDWAQESRERAEKDSFWNEFFEVFGKSRRNVGIFEKAVKKLGGSQGYIDVFWPGQLLIEHKSKGKDLDAAYEQASEYFHGLKEEEIPRYVLVSDFQRFKLYDLEDKTEHEFTLKDFHKNIKLFGFIAGYKKREFKEEDPVNIKAAEMMGKLHDQLEESGYEGHPLEVFLVRLLFCLFADDTAIFEKDTFKHFIEIKTSEDGSNLGALLAQFFQVLNTPKENRLKNLDEDLSSFPYVNGKLFEEQLPIAAFDSKMRDILLECSSLDWGDISPAIFGSLFQSVMNPEERRNLGAHYTSEKNILKVIKPLFLDELHEEFQKARDNSNKLREFHKKLGSLKFLDPACGCGNFLIITYRELRLLELEVLKKLYGNQQALGIDQIMLVDVDQFYGIEIDEFASRIAEVAMWLIDHQMNLAVSEAFGTYISRLPLRKAAKIIQGNALQIEWNELIANNTCSYIIGNPPFYGKKEQTKEQKDDMMLVFKAVKGTGVLDYVTAWYLKASELINGTDIKVGFVSTNSIAQGEQAGILWNELFNNYGIKIHFAHRTFKWKNEARNNAAVHVVIIGFANFDSKEKYLFEYEDIQAEPLMKKVKNINPYLVEGDDITISSRSKPINNVSLMNYGSMPIDDGHLILSKEEKERFINDEPFIEPLIRKYTGGREFINKIERWCIWLENTEPKLFRKSKNILHRVSLTKSFRQKSKRAATNKLASTPTLFGEIRQPNSPYLIVPKVSSENRKYIPIGIMSADIISSGSLLVVPNSSLYEFGMLTSEMHMAWVKYTCGRMKSDFQYSTSIVYNNYPWPLDPSEKNKKAVETKAQRVLDVREEFKDSSLADLYDPIVMPPKLVKAHQELDKAVDLCYRPQAFTSEAKRIEFLFDLYVKYTEPLLSN